jgi:hypothetical protein
MKKKQKRFYILQANSLNKEDIGVRGYDRYGQIAAVRQIKHYQGQKTLKVQTLIGATRMRITYFQDRQFYVRVQRDLQLLGEIPPNYTKSWLT